MPSKHTNIGHGRLNNGPVKDISDFPGDSVVKNLPANAKRCRRLRFYPESISWTEEPGGLWFLYSLKESGMTEHADTTTNDILILGACKYYFVWQK